MSGDPPEQNFSVSLHDELSVSDTYNPEVTTYPQILLNTARKFIDAGDFSIAVVVAHMACEIATERSISKAFTSRGILYLEASVKKFLNGYNLNNKQIRNLYVSLTGDEVHKQRFWSKFKESAQRRYYSRREDCGEAGGRGVV